MVPAFQEFSVYLGMFYSPHYKILEMSGWVLIISISQSPHMILDIPSAF